MTRNVTTKSASQSAKVIAWLFCLSAILAGTSLANAQSSTVSYTIDIPSDTLDWDQVVSVPMFNPALGTLNSIMFSVNATYNVTAQAENLAKSGKTASWEGILNQTLTRDDGSTLVDVAPFQWSFSKVLAAYDKVTDFAGASGVTYAESGNSSGSFVSTLAGDLAAFTGTGVISLAAMARENTTFTGSSGNMLQIVTSEAGSSIGVTYSFTPPPIPEPVTILGVSSGVCMLSGYIRKRLRKGFVTNI